MTKAVPTFVALLLILLANTLFAQEVKVAQNDSIIKPFDQNTANNVNISLDDKIKALQKEIDGLKKAQEKFEKSSKDLKKQGESLKAIEKKMPRLVEMGHGAGSMKLNGRIHADYWTLPDVHPGIFPLEGGDPQDRIGFRRLRFGVKGNIKDKMFYKIEMEFAGGNDVEFRDAYLGFDDTPLFNKVIIGNHKRPLGLDHINSSRYNVFLERPFVIESFNQDARRLGISSNGHTEDLGWNWRYGVYNMRLVQALGNYLGDHYQLELDGRLARTFWWDESTEGRTYAHFALAGALRFPDGLGGGANEARYRHRAEARHANRWLDTGRIVGANQENIVGVESVFNFGSLQIVSEYLVSNVQRTAGFGNTVLFHGGYVYAAYFLTGEHMPWDRKTGQLARIKPFQNFFRYCEDGCLKRGIGAWQVAARYSIADFTDEDIVGGEAQSLTLGLNWYWNPYARMQFNYILGDVDRQAAGGGDYQIFGVRFMVDF